MLLIAVIWKFSPLHLQDLTRKSITWLKVKRCMNKDSDKKMWKGIEAVMHARSVINLAVFNTKTGSSD